MTTAETKDTTVDGTTETDVVAKTKAAVSQVRDGVGDAMSHVPDVLESARSGVDQVAERMPAAVETTRVAAVRTNSQLQTLPDQTLRLLAVASIGLSTGLTLARAPRLIAFAALVPALFVGGALATRPRNDFGTH